MIARPPPPPFTSQHGSDLLWGTLPTGDKHLVLGLVMPCHPVIPQGLVQLCPDIVCLLPGGQQLGYVVCRPCCCSTPPSRPSPARYHSFSPGGCSWCTYESVHSLTCLCLHGTCVQICAARQCCCWCVWGACNASWLGQHCCGSFIWMCCASPTDSKEAEKCSCPPQWRGASSPTGTGSYWGHLFCRSSCWQVAAVTAS